MTLDAILTESALEPVELPRMTTSMVFTHYNRLGTQLESAIRSFKALPDASPQGCTDELKELVKACENAIRTAQRLLEANR